jgi:hypothetical protein
MYFGNNFLSSKLTNPISFKYNQPLKKFYDNKIWGIHANCQKYQNFSGRFFCGPAI